MDTNRLYRVVTTRWGGSGIVAPLSDILRSVSELSAEYPDEFYALTEDMMNERLDGSIQARLDGEEWELLFRPEE